MHWKLNLISVLDTWRQTVFCFLLNSGGNRNKEFLDQYNRMFYN